jgi:hypothetical protein
MKTTILSIAIAAGSVVSLAGCSFAARSPEMYRDDTKAVLETKNNDIRACYDGVLASAPGSQGKVTLTFEVETEQGKIVNIAVDKANTTAPDPVAECVTKSINGLGLAPPDKRTGQATFSWEFTAPPPPSAPGVGAAAPKT